VPVPVLDFSRLSPSPQHGPRRSLSVDHAHAVERKVEDKDFKAGGGRAGALRSTAGEAAPAAGAGAGAGAGSGSPQPKSAVDKKSAALAKAKLAQRSTPEQCRDSSNNSNNNISSTLNLTQLTSSPYNITSSPYEARLGLSSSFADTVEAHSAGASPSVPVPLTSFRKQQLAPLLSALSQQQQLQQPPQPSPKQKRATKPVKVKASATSRMDDSTRGGGADVDAGAGADGVFGSEMDDSARSYGRAAGNLDDSSHHRDDVKIKVKARGKAAQHTDLRAIGASTGAGAGTGGASLYSQQEYSQTNLGAAAAAAGQRPSPVGILKHLNSFGSPVALQQQQTAAEREAGISTPVHLTGRLSDSGKHFQTDHGIDRQRDNNVMYGSPVRYLPEAPAYADLSPIVVRSPDGDDGDGKQASRSLQDLAFADDSDEGEGDGYGGNMDRSEQDEGGDSDGSGEPAFGEVRDRRDKRSKQRRIKDKNGCCAICSDIMNDIRAYLRDIECEELLPDCSPVSWRRLLCTQRGRQSMTKPVLLYIAALSNILCKLNVTGNREKDIPTLAVAGLGISFFIETYCAKFDSGPRYNVVVFLALIIAGTYPHFPPKKMSPQIVLTILVAISVGLDCITLFLAPMPPPALIRLLTGIQCACKVYTLQTHFLQHARGTMKARKYLWRRLRLFLIPFNEPRRIMKDIRARIMAVGWVQLVAACVYAACFAASITTYGYQIMAGAGRAGISLPMFLLIKGISSAALFIGILLDTDVTLSLAFFGCLGWNMAYVKKYTREKKEELGGWPYAYFYNATRYTFLTMGKSLDFAWGVVGWITLSSHFGKSFYTLDSSLRFFLTLVMLTLVCTDVWVPILMYCINWLIRRHNFMLETETLSDSDDSELDELGIRTVLSPLKRGRDDGRSSLSRRRHTRDENMALYGDEDSPVEDKNDLGNSDSDTESTDSDLSVTEIQRKRRKRKERQKMRRKSRRLALQAFLQTESKGIKEKAEAARLPRKWSGADIKQANDNEDEDENEEDDETLDGAVEGGEGGTGDNTGIDDGSDDNGNEDVGAYDEEIDWNVPDQDDMAHAPSQFASSRTPRSGEADRTVLAEWELEDTPPRLKKLQDAEKKAQAREKERARREEEALSRENGGSPEALVAKGSFYGTLEGSPENLQMGKQEIEVDYGTYSDPEDMDTAGIMLTLDAGLDDYSNPIGDAAVDAYTETESDLEAGSPQSQRFVFTWGDGASDVDADTSFDRENATARMDTSFERPGLDLLANALGSGRETDRSESIFDLSVEMDPFEVKAIAGGFKRDSDDEDMDGPETEAGRGTSSAGSKDSAEERNLALGKINERILIAKAQAKADASRGDYYGKSTRGDKGYRAKEEQEQEQEQEEEEYLGEEDEVASPLLASQAKSHSPAPSHRARPPPPARMPPSPNTASKRREVGDLNVGRLQTAARAPASQAANTFVSEAGDIITAPPKEALASTGPFSRRDGERPADSAAQDSSADEVVLDLHPFIKPDAFSHLWDVLAVAAEFGCNVTALHSGASSGAVVQHLTRLGFCVVATGALTDVSPTTKRPRFDSLNGFKVFVFASGYLRGEFCDGVFVLA